MSTTTLTVRVAADTAKRLGRLAKATARSRSYLAAEAIEEYLALQEWQVQAIHAGLEQAQAGRGRELAKVRGRWVKRANSAH